MTWAVGVAAERLTRVMALVDGVATLIFALVALSATIQQWQAIPVGWSIATCAVLYGTGTVLAVVALRGPMKLIRALLTIMAIGYPVVAITFPLVMAGSPLDPDLGLPWILTVETIGTASAAILWRPSVAWALTIVASLIIGVDRMLVSPIPVGATAFQDAMGSFEFDAVFTALGLAIRRAARRLDEAAAAASAETRAAAIADARDREHGRIETLVHDTVLVALLGSARSAPEPVVRSAARRAIDEIDAVERPRDARPPLLETTPAAWIVQSVATELAPDARFDYVAAPDGMVPRDVVEAITEATAEALRNSSEHAGTEVNRAVHVEIGGGRMEVDILDDGRGFDPDSIDGARLGIAVSIVGRMRTIPGGSAVVVSHPGVGTRIGIRWREPGGDG